jgi:osmotically-inducible protein OsmY
MSTPMTIKSAGDPANLGDASAQSLHRSWYFDSHSITFTIVGGKVRLTGTVHSLAERNEALAAAWGTPGTIAVVDDIANV